MWLSPPIRNPVQTARFTYHFIRGRNALFETRAAKAKEHFTKAVQLGRNNSLWAEALLFLADSQQQTGETKKAAETAADGLSRMSESDTYTSDDVAYMRAYMARLLNMPLGSASSDAFDAARVRPSLRRDFPFL